MKSKAFTLIELLGVMVLITLLALVIIPNVTTYIKKASIKADENTLSNIKSAAKTYMADNSDDLNVGENKILCVYKSASDNANVIDLIETGYLDMTKDKREKFKQQCVIVTRDQNKKISYDLKTKDEITVSGNGGSVRMDNYTYGGNLPSPSLTSINDATSIQYYYSKDKVSWKSFDTVNTSSALVPGTYYMYAKYNAGGKTQQTSTISFTVYKATVNLKLTMDGYMYGGQISKPSLTSDVDMSNIKVTYYYSQYQSLKNSQIWDSNSITSTTLSAGTYYMYAKTSSNDYYKAGESDKVQFDVTRQDIEKLTISPKTYIYDGKTKSASLNGTTDATIDYEYYTGDACSQKLTTDNSKNGLPINVGTYSVVAYLNASDKNHTLTNEGECVKNAITINKRTITALWGTNTSFVYNGSIQKPTAEFYALDDSGNKKTIEEVTGEKLSFSISGQKDVGSNYTATASIQSASSKTSNYELKNNTCNFSITKASTSLKALDTTDNTVSVMSGESGEVTIKLTSTTTVNGTLSLDTDSSINANFDNDSTSIYASSTNDGLYKIKYNAINYPKDTNGKATIKIGFIPDDENNFSTSSLTINVIIKDGAAPVVTFTPNGDSDNISTGRSVSVDITDEGSGIKGDSQTIYYAWSKDKNNAPSYFNNIITSETKKVSNLKVGDYVKMSPSNTSFTTDTAYTGSSGTSTINISDLDVWRVVKINDDNTVTLVSEYVSSEDVTFTGKTGYMNYVGYLNTIAKQYENSIYTLDSKHFGYNKQMEYCLSIDDCNENADYKNDTSLLTSILPAKRKNGSTVDCYWLASRTSDYTNAFVNSSGTVDDTSLKLFDDKAGTSVSKSCAIRPVITLKSTAEYIVSNNNSLTEPYELANSFEGSTTLNIKDGTISASFDVPETASSDLTGTYYLWIKGGISDVSLEKSVDTVSDAFTFNNESPSFKLSSSSKANAITVTVNSSSDDAIYWNYKYELNGQTIESNSDDAYTFKNLKENTEYNISVTVTNGAGKSIKKSITVSTKTFDAPTFSRTGNTLSIIYPKDKNGTSLCNNGYTCTYAVYQNATDEYKTYNASGDINFDNEGSSDFKNMTGNRIVLATIYPDQNNIKSATFTYTPLPIIKSFAYTTSVTDLDKAFRSNTYKDYITEIFFTNSVDVPSSAINVRTDENTNTNINYFDVSEEGDETVKAWLIKNDDTITIDDTTHETYTLYIGASGKVYGNKNSSKLFSSMSNLKYINFNGNYDTSLTEKMSNLFAGDTSLISLDLADFDTSNVVDYSFMFSECKTLSSIDLSYFKMKSELSKNETINMRSMFASATSLTSIKFGNIDTSNVSVMSSMFSGLTSMTTLNLCEFNTKKVNDMSYMFENSSSLTKVYVGSNWSTALAAATSGGIDNMYTGSGIDSTGVTENSCLNITSEIK